MVPFGGFAEQLLLGYILSEESCYLEGPIFDVWFSKLLWFIRKHCQTALTYIFTYKRF
jgi:hypothetical protein